MLFMSCLQDPSLLLLHACANYIFVWVCMYVGVCMSMYVGG